MNHVVGVAAARAHLMVFALGGGRWGMPRHKIEVLLGLVDKEYSHVKAWESGWSFYYLVVVGF